MYQFGLLCLLMVFMGAASLYRDRVFDNIYGSDHFCWDGSYTMVTKGPVQHKSRNYVLCHSYDNKLGNKYGNFLSPAGAVGPGTGDIATPPSVRPPRPSVCLSVRLSVTFSFRTVTQKRIAVFSRNFPGTCTKS